MFLELEIYRRTGELHNEEWYFSSTNVEALENIIVVTYSPTYYSSMGQIYCENQREDRNKTS